MSHRQFSCRHLRLVSVLNLLLNWSKLLSGDAVQEPELPHPDEISQLIRPVVWRAGQRRGGTIAGTSSQRASNLSCPLGLPFTLPFTLPFMLQVCHLLCPLACPLFAIAALCVPVLPVR